MIDFPTTKLPKGEFHLVCFLIRLNALNQALEQVPSSSRYKTKAAATAKALDDLESFLLLTTGKPLRPVILSIISDSMNRWMKSTISETVTTSNSDYHLEYLQTHLEAIVKYGKRSAKLLPHADRYRMLKLLARIEPATNSRMLKYGDLEDDFERDFLAAVEDVIEKSWSQFAPIPRDSWRSLPSMVTAFTCGRNSFQPSGGNRNSGVVHTGPIPNAA